MMVANKYKEEQIGKESINYQGDKMKIVVYNDSKNIIVEFQDKFRTLVKTRSDRFRNGQIKNPYHPSVYGVGMVGNKYPSNINGKDTKEYKAWNHILERCYSEKFRKKQPTYKDVTVCDEWLYFPNFYEWIHSQENFNAWYNGDRWGLDKDILIKGCKVYSPDTCCLVPINVNSLFTKNNAIRGSNCIGVHKQNGKYLSLCNNPFTKKQEYLGSYDTQEEAFYVYKPYKENIIKQVAQEEYNKGNITKECYDAMMKYEVEITD